MDECFLRERARLVEYPFFLGLLSSKWGLGSDTRDSDLIERDRLVLFFYLKREIGSYELDWVQICEYSLELLSRGLANQRSRP